MHLSALNRIALLCTALALLVPCASARPAIPSAGTRRATAASSKKVTDSASLEEVLVTAQRRTERLVEVPMSVTVISRQELQIRGFSQPSDLEEVVPGFTYRLSQYGTPIYSIRGVGFYDEQALSSPAVAIYTDQIPLPYARMAEGATLDLERTEVMKGPQGTSFGENSTGGAVNYVAAKPTQTFESGLNLDAARFDRLQGGGFVSGPISRRLDARFAARAVRSGGWQTSRTRNASAGRTDFYTARFLLDGATDALSFELNLNGWRDRSDEQVLQARGYLPVNPALPTTSATMATAQALSAYPYLSRNSNRVADWDPALNLARNDVFHQGALRLETNGAGAHLISITNFAGLHAHSPIDTDGTDYTAHLIAESATADTLSEELRLESGVAARRSWGIGASYGHDRLRDFQAVTLNGSNSELESVHFDGLDLYNNQSVRDTAAFGHFDVRISPTISLQNALRYTKEHRLFSGCMADSGGPLGFRIVLGFLGISSGECITLGPDGKPGMYRTALDQSNVSFREGVTWRLKRSAQLYATVARGYKAGSFDSLPALSYRQLQPVTQESVLAYEIGVRRALAAGDISAAVFYYDYQNKQIAGYLVVPPFGNLPNLVSIPKSRVAGAELAIMHAGAHLRLAFDATFVNSRVLDRALVSSPFGTSVDARGEPFPASPRWQIHGSTRYELHVQRGWRPYIGAQVTYRSGTTAAFGAYSGPPGTQSAFLVRAYALLDVELGITRADGRYSVEAYARNLTDTAYWNNVTHVYDTYGRITGRPRAFGVRFSARW